MNLIELIRKLGKTHHDEICSLNFSRINGYGLVISKVCELPYVLIRNGDEHLFNCIVSNYEVLPFGILIFMRKDD